MNVYKFLGTIFRCMTKKHPEERKPSVLLCTLYLFTKIFGFKSDIWMKNKKGTA